MSKAFLLPICLAEICANKILSNLIENPELAQQAPLNDHMYFVLANAKCDVCTHHLCNEDYTPNFNPKYHIRDIGYTCLKLCDDCHNESLRMFFYNCYNCGTLGYYNGTGGLCKNCYYCYMGGEPITNLLHFTKNALKNGPIKHILYDGIYGPLTTLEDASRKADIENHIDENLEYLKYGYDVTYEEMCEVAMYASIEVISQVSEDTYRYHLDCYRLPKFSPLSTALGDIDISIIIDITFNGIIIKTCKVVENKLGDMDNFELIMQPTIDLIGFVCYIINAQPTGKVILYWSDIKLAHYCSMYHEIMYTLEEEYEKKEN